MHTTSEHPKAIRIANPRPGGKYFTSWKRAQHYIDSGRAVLQTNGTQQGLYFLERDHRNQAAARCAERVNSDCQAPVDPIRARLDSLPTWPPMLKVSPGVPTQPLIPEGFNRYPMPRQETNGPKFPAFARQPW